MNEEERAVDVATQAVVGYIKNDLQDNPVFDDLVDTLIQQSESSKSVQQLYFASSAGDHNHQAIELLYTELWKLMEQAAMKYVIAKLMVENYA